MARGKKRLDLGPRRKRMRRLDRLQAGAKWRSGYGGKNIVHGYARWFGVDLMCAIVELRMLGVGIDADYELRVRRSIAARSEVRRQQRASKLAKRTQPSAIEGSADWPAEWIPNDDEANAEVRDEIPF